jgi:hypothetical protein
LSRAFVWARRALRFLTGNNGGFPALAEAQRLAVVASTIVVLQQVLRTHGRFRRGNLVIMPPHSRLYDYPYKKNK